MKFTPTYLGKAVTHNVLPKLKPLSKQKTRQILKLAKALDAQADAYDTIALLNEILRLVAAAPWQLLDLPAPATVTKICDLMLKHNEVFFMGNELCHYPYAFMPIACIPTKELIDMYNQWALGKRYQQHLARVPEADKPAMLQRYQHIAHTLKARKELIFAAIENRGFKILKGKYVQTMPPARRENDTSRLYKKVLFSGI